MANKTAHYGWIPDIPDHRDLIYAAPRPIVKKLPLKADLRKECPPIYDQGQIRSCTANAIGAAFEYGLDRENRSKDFMPSRLFIYYNERSMENAINSDSGAQIRDGIKSVVKQGVCPETMWPYDPQKLTKKPQVKCYKAALKHQVESYHRLNRDINQMKGCLADGYPFIFGFTVYSSFESGFVANSGILNMPQKNEQNMGGHAVLAVGYNDNAKRFIVRNSWGNNWGLAGYFTMPYDYLLDENLSDDFWTIRLVE